MPSTACCPSSTSNSPRSTACSSASRLAILLFNNAARSSWLWLSRAASVSISRCTVASRDAVDVMACDSSDCTNARARCSASVAISSPSRSTINLRLIHCLSSRRAASAWFSASVSNCGSLAYWVNASASFSTADSTVTGAWLLSNKDCRQASVNGALRDASSTQAMWSLRCAINCW